MKNIYPELTKNQKFIIAELQFAIETDTLIIPEVEKALKVVYDLKLINKVEYNRNKAQISSDTTDLVIHRLMDHIPTVHRREIMADYRTGKLQ